MSDSEQLVPQLIEIADQAAAAILKVYAEDFDVEHKADSSPLTKADLAAHRIIVDGLRGLQDQFPILSEESADIDWPTRRRWQRYWLVDPLDGTREFVKRNGEFTVNIALIDQGNPIIGVVLAPVSGTCWFASPAGGAHRRQDNRIAPIRVAMRHSGRMRVAASRSHLDPKTERLIEKIGDVEKIGLGSSIKFCRLAEGELDVYPRFGPTSEWDTAAGQCVLQAAGGAVLSLDGRPLQYNQKESLLNPEFIALGNADVDWRSWLD